MIFALYFLFYFAFLIGIILLIIIGKYFILFFSLCFTHTSSLTSMDTAKYFQNGLAELVEIWHTVRVFFCEFSDVTHAHIATILKILLT
jgi:hypothetical protein